MQNRCTDGRKAGTQCWRLQPSGPHSPIRQHRLHCGCQPPRQCLQALREHCAPGRSDSHHQTTSLVHSQPANVQGYVQRCTAVPQACHHERAVLQAALLAQALVLAGTDPQPLFPGPVRSAALSIALSLPVCCRSAPGNREHVADMLVTAQAAKAMLTVRQLACGLRNCTAMHSTVIIGGQLIPQYWRQPEHRLDACCAALVTKWASSLYGNQLAKCWARNELVIQHR